MKITEVKKGSVGSCVARNGVVKHNSDGTPSIYLCLNKISSTLLFGQGCSEDTGSIVMEKPKEKENKRTTGRGTAKRTVKVYRRVLRGMR